MLWDFRNHCKVCKWVLYIFPGEFISKRCCWHEILTELNKTNNFISYVMCWKMEWHEEKVLNYLTLFYSLYKSIWSLKVLWVFSMNSELYFLFSIGFRSGNWLGHSSSLIFFFWYPLIVFLPAFGTFVLLKCPSSSLCPCAKPFYYS